MALPAPPELIFQKASELRDSGGRFLQWPTTSLGAEVW
jgi:hypothetical protein